MPGENEALTNIDETGLDGFDSLADFVEIEDLADLEGMEEFIDLEDLEAEDQKESSVGQAEADEALAFAVDQDEASQPIADTSFDETLGDAGDAALAEMLGEPHIDANALFDGMDDAPEATVEADDTDTDALEVDTGVTADDAPDVILAEEPQSGTDEPADVSDAALAEDATEEAEDVLALDDMAEDMVVAEEQDGVLEDAPSADMPEDVLSLDETTEEAHGIALEEAQEEVAEAEDILALMDEEEAEVDVSQTEEAAAPDSMALTDADIVAAMEADAPVTDESANVATDGGEVSEMGITDADIAAALEADETPSGETDDGDLDSMLDGLLDDLDTTGTIPEEKSATPKEEIEEIEEGDAADLLDLIEGVEKLPPEEEPLEAPLPTETETEEKKPGLLKRLFGNIITDEIAEAERQAMQEEKEQAEEKAEQDAKRKEEKAAEKEQKAEEKAAEKAKKAEEKAAKKAQKAAEKAEKKAKKAEEAAAEEQFEVTGKLNKVGVSIIAVLTVIFLATEIIGTNQYTIHATKSRANKYFELGKYTDAYQEILGTDLKTKDPETYNKIKTVMTLQRSINSYNNYLEMNYYPDALNALLRGLQKYDTNLDQAKKYGVLSEVDQCRAQIVSLLQSEFGISESKAKSVLALDQEKYTEKVVTLSQNHN